MSLDSNEDLKVGFDVSENIDGYDFHFNENLSFNEQSDQETKVSLSRKF